MSAGVVMTKCFKVKQQNRAFTELISNNFRYRIRFPVILITMVERRIYFMTRYIASGAVITALQVYRLPTAEL